MPDAPADRPARALVGALTRWLLLAVLCAIGTAHAQSRPTLPDLSGIVKDEGWARILGKALFWDTLATADGAGCGTCHFATGANLRIPDQAAGPLQLRRAAATDLATSTAEIDQAGCADGRAVLYARARQIAREVADFGPVRGPLEQPSAADPECAENARARRARMVLGRQPLIARSIDPRDDTFGSSGPHGNLVSPTGRGLDRTYQWMIQQAFADSLWDATGDAVRAGDAHLTSPSGRFSRVEQNFPLFWGIAVMIYESTLDPQWDRPHGSATTVRAPPPAEVLTPQLL